jgi:hypothetical protein
MSSSVSLLQKPANRAREGPMDLAIQVKQCIYRHFAETALGPSPEQVARHVGSDVASVLDVYRQLRAQRLLVLEADSASIRMAPPFSGVPTQHKVEAGGLHYFANCAWDALGIPAAIHLPATVHSRCEQSGAPLHLQVSREGPEPSDWLFHCLVPASKWWHDIVFT